MFVLIRFELSFSLDGLSFPSAFFACGIVFVLIRFELTPEVTLLVHSASMQCPASQSALREFWRGGQADRMCALEIAKAWALREASRELHGGEDKLPMCRCAGGQKRWHSPSREALRQLFVTIDSDPDWFPGKHNGEKRGPPPLCLPT